MQLRNYGPVNPTFPFIVCLAHITPRSCSAALPQPFLVHGEEPADVVCLACFTGSAADVRLDLCLDRAGPAWICLSSRTSLETSIFQCKSLMTEIRDSS